MTKILDGGGAQHLINVFASHFDAGVFKIGNESKLDDCYFPERGCMIANVKFHHEFEAPPFVFIQSVHAFGAGANVSTDMPDYIISKGEVLHPGKLPENVWRDNLLAKQMLANFMCTVSNYPAKDGFRVYLSMDDITYSQMTKLDDPPQEVHGTWALCFSWFAFLPFDKDLANITLYPPN